MPLLVPSARPLVRLLAASFLVASVAAASAQGVVRGTVTDGFDGGPLPGANVVLVGTALGAATDIEGGYRIQQVPAGAYTLRASYVGYTATEVAVTVVDGETLTLNVELRAGETLDEVVVSAQLEGQRAAINQQLASNTIVNVVSEEKIQELPDANAAESIGRLAGVSVQRSGGEANQITLRGLSGAFTNVTVDGVQVSPTDPASRSVDLSAISQGSLSGIELFKAITPDKDGDAIAGSVNLVTRRAPQDRELRVDALGSYNALESDLGQYDTDFRYGERFFNGFLGVQLSGNLERRNRSREVYDPNYDCSFDPVPGVEPDPKCRIQDLELEYTDEIRERRGVGGIFDVGTPDGGFVKLSALYNQTSRNLTSYGRNFPTDGDPLFYAARDREQTVRLFTGALTGEQYLLGAKADWGASYSRSASEYPFDYQLQFTEPSTTDAEGNLLSGMGSIPEGVVEDGQPEDLLPYAANNFDLAYLYSAFYNEEESSDDNLAGYLNLERAFTLSPSLRATFKAGGKYRSRGRSRDRSEVFSPYYNTPFPQFVQLEDGTIVQKDFTGTSFENYDSNGNLVIATNFLGDGREEGLFDDRFQLTPLLDRDRIREWYALNINGVRNAQGSDLEYEVNREPETDFYDITERVSAGYAMGTFDVGRFATLVTGLRVEHEDNDYASRYAPNGLDGVPVPTGAIRDTSSTFDQTVWLPNAQLALRPADFVTIRLAAYRALARPNFNDRLANYVARRAGFFFPNTSIVIGNPALRTATAWNYETGVSFFGPRLGLFSVNAFYKEIDDYFQTINGNRYKGSAIFDDLGIDFNSPFGPDAVFQLRAPYNLDEPTKVYGLEVEHQSNLSYLENPLSGVVFGYNFSLVRSETYVPRVRVDTVIELVEVIPGLPPVEVEVPTFVPYEQKQKLQSQPDFFANVSLGYDFRGFSARASVFHQSRYTSSFGGNASTSYDSYRDGFTRLDLAFRQAIGSRFQLLLNVNNVTGVEERAIRYNELVDRTYVNDSEIYGTTVDLGVRIDL